MDPSHFDWQTIIGSIVTIASILSNIIPSHTIVGKILHFFALNFRSGSLSQAQNVASGSGESGGGA